MAAGPVAYDSAEGQDRQRQPVPGTGTRRRLEHAQVRGEVGEHRIPGEGGADVWFPRAVRTARRHAPYT